MDISKTPGVQTAIKNASKKIFKKNLVELNKKILYISV